MSADTPAVAAEPTDFLRPIRILLIETQYELARLLRTRAYSLSTIGLPVLLYLLFGVAQRGTTSALYLVAGYTCMGVVSACLFGMGICGGRSRRAPKATCSKTARARSSPPP